MMKFIRNILICSILISWSSLIYPQEDHYVFSHLDVNDGLSENRTKCIIRDKNGFVWFGTSSGLNRFDGYEFQIFTKDPNDSLSLFDNDINEIAEDFHGNLWIGTKTGINLLDINTYKVRRIILRSSLPLNCADINYCTALTSDSSGNIWIGTHNGLFFISHSGGSVRHILLDEESCYSPFNNITALANDRAGSVWIGTGNGYIYRYNPGMNSVEKLESQIHFSGDANGIRELYTDREGFLWIADSYGLLVFNTEKRSWMRDLGDALAPVFSKLQITGISQDEDERMWITTDGGGLFIITRDGFRITNLQNRPYTDEGISSDGLISLYIDRTGISWIGTAKKGVDFYKRNIRKFRLIRNYPTDENSLANNDVNAITEDSSGNLWIGTNGGGADYLDVRTGRYTHYRNDPANSNSLCCNNVVSVFEDSQKKVWIGTYRGGLSCFDPANGLFKTYRFSEEDSTTISDNSIWSICEDSRQNLWVATLTNGLNLFERSTGRFRRFQSQNSSLCFNYLNFITTDGSDNLWICSSNGLIFFNPSQNMSVCYTNNPEDKSSISDNHISSVFEDSRGLFWVCTGNGLNLMDRKRNTFRSFYESDGLPSNCVLRMLEDKNHDLWVSTKNGLSRIKVTWLRGGDSLTFSFTNFRMSDGLQGREFNETAAASTSGGELLFGGPEGLNSFYPLEIRQDASSPVIVFTNFRVFNDIIKPGEKFNNRVLLEKPVFNTSEIILRHRENSFTIDFAALNFFFPERTQYLYILEGFNRGWIRTEGRKNFATYSNLDQGTYVFRLRGTNSDGIWSENEISLKIRVLPPLWKTWYAYVFYGLLITGSLGMIRYYTLKSERFRTRMEQERIAAEHVHEIDSLKLKFFTNISHEFRTPLTLIISPVEQMLIKLKGKPEEKHLKLVKQNARRLLLMVNQLLDFRKMEVQGFRYQPSYGDIISFLNEAVNSFSDLSEQKHILLNFSSDIDHLDTWFDKDKLEKIVFNLLSNAFKFVHENGRISVAVWLDRTSQRKEQSLSSRKNRNLVIEVEDDGIGITQEKQEKLFDGIYQNDDSGLAEQGNGIGLSLVKEFVRLHGGDVSVRSEPGRGSTFIVSIPVQTIAEESESGKGEEVSAESEDPSGSRPVILIAEDNDDLRFYLKENLRKKYVIHEAADGDSAFRKILKVIPDLIISDIMMPGIDGVELCRRVKSEKTTRHIPLILLTAKYTEQNQVEGIEAGADDYITKPFNFQILQSKIDNLIKTTRSIKSLFRSKLDIEPPEIKITTLDEQFIEKAMAVVEKNMADADFTVEEFSSQMGMSRTLLYKKILSLTGKPPLEFIRLFRLKRAAVLLQKSQLNVSEVTFRVGFKDTKYFRRQFRKVYGVLPSHYQGNRT
jgi:ligand-binding sensor domain-containing protein/signal transduction histidine kinase/DNA-binding response OmpR family regulator